MIAALVAAALLTPTPSPTPLRAPEPVVERTVVLRERAIRTSLFTNRVAVVAVREHGVQVFVARLTLDEPAYTAYLGAVERDAAAAEPDRAADAARTRESSATIELWIGGEGSRRIDYAPIDTLDLATARLVATLDDLERLVLEASPSAEALRGWEPRRGDLVELHTGRLAEVTDVREDGALVLEHLETALIEVVAAGSRDQVILRVLQERRR